MLGKAPGLPADMVFLDLEDAVAPLAKADARRNVVAALREGGWAAGTRAVRVNDLSTAWTYRDVVEVVEGAGARLDSIVLPKVTGPEHIVWLDLTLAQIERALGLPVGGIGIEAQIETARGLSQVSAIAAASPRLETLVLGPADLMASLSMRSFVVGGLHPDYPGDPFHAVLVSILVAARAYDLQAIDGPYLRIHDIDGLRTAAWRSAVLGYDGKWVLHPGQIEAVNEIFAPSQADYEHAEAILDAYQHATSAAGGAVGAVMLGDEMIDEASRKMALVVAAKGRAAGLTRGATGH
jgi:citrate lyase subunit beta/citryl-CoA lyase